MNFRKAIAAVISLIAIVSSSAVAQKSANAAEASFGAAITAERKAAVAVSSVFENSTLRGTTVLINGSIDDVCTQKGCWLVVTDGRNKMRVTFKDYGFFVPMDSHKRQVLLEGIVTEKEISEEDARHYASESTTGPKPEDIHGPQKSYTMEATGVVIVGE